MRTQKIEIQDGRANVSKRGQFVILRIESTNAEIGQTENIRFFWKFLHFGNRIVSIISPNGCRLYRGSQFNFPFRNGTAVIVKHEDFESFKRRMA